MQRVGGEGVVGGAKWVRKGRARRLFCIHKLTHMNIACEYSHLSSFLVASSVRARERLLFTLRNSILMM